MKRSSGAAALRDEFATARRPAAWLAGPAPKWTAGGSRRSTKRRVGLAAGAIAVGGALGWGWLEMSGQSASPVSSDPSPPAVILPAARGGSPPPASPAPPATFAPATRQPSIAVIRRGGVVRIDLVDAPWSEAAAALAGATGTTVRGGEALRAAPGRATLRWAGTSTAAAWEALLGRVANTAVSCGPAACELWIAGLHAAPRQGADGPPLAADVAVEPSRPAPVAAPAPPPPADDGDTN